MIQDLFIVIYASQNLCLCGQKINWIENFLPVNKQTKIIGF